MLLTLQLIGQIPVERITLSITEDQRRLAPAHSKDMIVGVSVLVEGFRRGAVIRLLDLLDLFDLERAVLNYFLSVVVLALDALDPSFVAAGGRVLVLRAGGRGGQALQRRNAREDSECGKARKARRSSWHGIPH